MNGHIIPGTSIAVDFWKVQGRQESYVHFLTHLHGDHIVGLTSSWKRPIYCSAFTAVLLEQQYGILSSFLEIVPINQSIIINVPPHQSFCVTAFDANHCPGAVMFHFEGDFGSIFYTGDFRTSSKLIRECQYLSGKIDVLYLDNTFCSPKCVFPSRMECFKEIVKICHRHSKHNIVIGVRSLGKESMLGNLGVVLDESITVSPKCYKIAMTLYSSNVFTTTLKGEITRIWTLPMHQISCSLIDSLNKNKPTIAIIPTALYSGLNMNPFKDNPNIFVIPYSDHSNYEELLQFVSALGPAKVIPIITSPKGPFSTNFKERADMSCFDSVLLPYPQCSSNQQKDNENSQEDSMLLTNNAIDQHENEDELLSSQDSSSNKYYFAKGHHSQHSSSIFPAQALKRNAKRRKKSVPLPSGRKKVKGVVFENFIEDDSQNTNGTDNINCNTCTINLCEEESILVSDDDSLGLELALNDENYDNLLDPAYEEQNMCNDLEMGEVNSENRSRQNDNAFESSASSPNTASSVKLENDIAEDNCSNLDQRTADLDFDSKSVVEQYENSNIISSQIQPCDSQIEDVQADIKPISLQIFNAISNQGCARIVQNSDEQTCKLELPSHAKCPQYHPEECEPVVTRHPYVGIDHQDCEDCVIINSPDAELDLKVEENNIEPDDIYIVDDCETEINNAGRNVNGGSFYADREPSISPCTLGNEEYSSDDDDSSSVDEDDIQRSGSYKSRYVCSCQAKSYSKPRWLWGNRTMQENKKASLKDPNLSDNNFISFVQIFIEKSKKD